MRAAVLLLLCGCQGVFDLHHIDRPPTDAAIPDAMPGLVAYYPMDGLDGRTGCMTDALGGPDGRCNNGMPALIDTPHAKGYQFNGTASITVVGMPAADNSPFTVSVWISVVTPLAVEFDCPANRVYGASGENSWQFCLASNSVFYDAGTANFYADGSALALNTWHQLAMTFDGTLLQGYLDGIPNGSIATTVQFDAQPTVLGMDLDGPNPSAPSRQAIDELRIYDRVLSPNEIAQLYQM